MKNERIKNWEQTKEQLKKEFPDLMKDDLLYELEKDQELLKRLQEN